MSVATLAGPGMAQELDGVDPETKRTFMHKYIFQDSRLVKLNLKSPADVKLVIGHLAERANVPALPSSR